jgi:hypothetical protein
MTNTFSNLDERWQFNLSAVEAWHDDDWTKWLLKTFHENDYRPLRLAPRQPPTSEIETFYRLANEDRRFHMKRGLTNAILGWDEDFHGLNTLRDLAWTVGKVRATEAIPALIKLLLINRSDMQHGRPFFDAADTLLGVLAGLAPDRRIETAFTALFHDSAVGPQFSATLALGISICDSDRFTEAFNRFVSLRAQIPTYFRDADVLRQFNDRLAQKTLWDSMGRLSLEAHRYARAVGISIGVFTRADLVAFDNELTPLHDSQPLAFPITTNDGLYQEAAERIRMASNQFRGSHQSLLNAIAHRLDTV